MMGLRLSRESSIEREIRKFKRKLLWGALRMHDGDICKTARFLGMHRNTLTRWIDDLLIDVESIRTGKELWFEETEQSGNAITDVA